MVNLARLWGLQMVPNLVPPPRVPSRGFLTWTIPGSARVEALSLRMFIDRPRGSRYILHDKTTDTLGAPLVPSTHETAVFHP